MLKILNSKSSYSRRLRLLSRELGATVILTILALAVIVATINGWTKQAPKMNGTTALVHGLIYDKKLDR